MDLFRIRAKKCIVWPFEITKPPKDIAARLTHLGVSRWGVNHPEYRSLEAGYVVDMDSPGETFFCRDSARNLEPVPRDEYPAAIEKLKDQGPISWQPALDWLDEQGLRKVKARPEEEAPEAEGVPLSKMKSDELKALCDALELPHGKVSDMRLAIQEALECDADAMPVLTPEGAVGLLEDSEADTEATK